MTVSLVGRIAIGISKSEFPDFVTQATWEMGKIYNQKITNKVFKDSNGVVNTISKSSKIHFYNT